MTNGEKFKEVFGFGADGSRVIAVNATWWDCEFQNSNKLITNADRIRAMTDEELADFLEKVADGCDSCPMLKECTYSDKEVSEKQIRLKWLKQETES